MGKGRSGARDDLVSSRRRDRRYAAAGGAADGKIWPTPARSDRRSLLADQRSGNRLRSPINTAVEI